MSAIPARLIESVGRVLVVDDDAVSRAWLLQLARRSGYDALAATDVAEARAIVESDGAGAFDCIITDHEMPGESGLDLLRWLQRLDPSLAVIMMTGTTERATITATLRGGAVDFLEKPVAPQDLARALDVALVSTRRGRAAATTLRQVDEVAGHQRHVMAIDVAAQGRLTVRCYPLREIGGDFVTARALEGGGMKVLVADCSGHDLGAAYVSAYFQGLTRGMLGEGRTVAQVMERFNDILLNEWTRDGASDARAGTPEASLSVCAVATNANGTRVRVTNAGAPAPWQVDRLGTIAELYSGRSQPLGWFADPLPETVEHACPAGGIVVLWTDGLEDLAEQRAVSPLALSTALVRADDARAADLVRGARDDVLVALLALQRLPTSAPAEGGMEPWLPVHHADFGGADAEAIDTLQAELERSIAMVAGEATANRVAEMLVTLREALLNAMVHGCEGRAERRGRVQLCIRPEARVLRAVVEDSGAGHDFDHHAHVAAAGAGLVDLHRGLSLIHSLASAVTTERHGARLCMDFRY